MEDEDLRKKEDIREKLRMERSSLLFADAEERSRKIMERLFVLPEFIDAKSVLFYLSIKNEVMTDEMIARAIADHGKKIAVPCVLWKKRQICLSMYDPDDEEKVFSSGLREPARRREIAPGEIDLAIVPGIAFDRSGNRIGYGKGYYDRLLAGMKVPKIALAYSFQVLDMVPRDMHDVRVDKIINEDECIGCKHN